MNVASPAAAMRWWRLPCHGVGLARMEYVINDVIQVHPLALTRPDDLEVEEARERIDEVTRGHDGRTEYFVDWLARALATIAASQQLRPRMPGPAARARGDRPGQRGGTASRCG